MFINFEDTPFQDKSAVIKEILELSQCPLGINDKYNSLQDELTELWKLVCYKKSISIEGKYVSYDTKEDLEFELEEDDLVTELTPALINMRRWIPEAQNEFRADIIPITTTIANSDIYEKHFLRKRLSIEEMQKLALKEKNSYLLADITSEVINDILITVVKDFFYEIILINSPRIAVNCDRTIGVTDKGIITQYLFIDIDGLSGEGTHAYPCSEVEATNNATSYIGNSDDIYKKYGHNINEFEDEPCIEPYKKYLFTNYSFPT